MFVNNYTERTWYLQVINDQVKELMMTYPKYPPRELQSEVYLGPITIISYQRFKYVQEQLSKDGFSPGLPGGN